MVLRWEDDGDGATCDGDGGGCDDYDVGNSDDVGRCDGEHGNDCLDDEVDDDDGEIAHRRAKSSFGFHNNVFHAGQNQSEIFSKGPLAPHRILNMFCCIFVGRALPGIIFGMVILTNNKIFWAKEGYYPTTKT